MTKRKNPFCNKILKTKKSKNLQINFLELEFKSLNDLISIEFYPSYEQYEKKGEKIFFNLDYNWFFQKLSLGKVISKPKLLGKGISGIVYNFSTEKKDFAVKIIGNPEIEDGFKGNKTEFIAHIKRELYKFSIDNTQLKNYRKEVEIQQILYEQDLAPEVYKFGFLTHNSKRGFYSHCFIVTERFETDVSKYIKILKSEKNKKRLGELEHKLVELTEKLSRSNFVCMDFKTDNMVINTETMDIKVIDFEGRFCISFKRFFNKLQTTYLKPLNKETGRKLLKLTYLYIIVGINIRRGIVLCVEPMIRLWKTIKDANDTLLTTFFNISTNEDENFAKNIEYYFDKFQLFNLFRVILKSKRLKHSPNFIESKRYPKIFNSMEREYKSCDHCYIL